MGIKNIFEQEFQGQSVYYYKPGRDGSEIFCYIKNLSKGEKIDLWRQRVCDNISIPDAPKQMRNIPPSSITKIEISQKVVADNGLKLKVYKESTLDSYSVEEIRQKDIVDTVFTFTLKDLQDYHFQIIYYPLK